MRAAWLLVMLALPALGGGGIRVKVDRLPPGARCLAFEAGRPGVEANLVNEDFEFAGLAPGTYNIEIRAGSLDVIGVDLRPRDAEGRPVEVSRVAPAVEKTIREFFEHTKDFFDRRRMPIVMGAGDTAMALIENIRSGDTTTYGKAGGKVLFRLDLWEFTKSFGSWRKTKSTVFVRRFLAADEFEATKFVYTTALGGIDLTSGEVRKVKFDLPVASGPDCEVKK